MEKKKLRVEITGAEADLNQLALFLRMAEYLGIVGSTRTLKLWVDGDGAGRLGVHFPDMEGRVPVADNWDTEAGLSFSIGD